MPKIDKVSDAHRFEYLYKMEQIKSAKAALGSLENDISHLIETLKREYSIASADTFDINTGAITRAKGEPEERPQATVRKAGRPRKNGSPIIEVVEGGQ